MARRELGTQSRLKMTAFIVSETYFKLFLVVDGLIRRVLSPFVYLLSRIMSRVICSNENVISDDVTKDSDVLDLFTSRGHVDPILIFHIFSNIFSQEIATTRFWKFHCDSANPIPRLSPRYRCPFRRDNEQFSKRSGTLSSKVVLGETFP